MHSRNDAIRRSYCNNPRDRIAFLSGLRNDIVQGRLHFGFTDFLPWQHRIETLLRNERRERLRTNSNAQRFMEEIVQQNKIIERQMAGVESRNRSSAGGQGNSNNIYSESRTIDTTENFEGMNQMLQPLDIQALDDQIEEASTASAAPAGNGSSMETSIIILNSTIDELESVTLTENNLGGLVVQYQGVEDRELTRPPGSF